MTAACYLDSSIVLAALYHETGALDLPSLPRAFTSVLTRVECLRSIDRHRATGRLTEERALEARGELFETLRSIRIAEVDSDVLDRASGSFAAPLRTLDAIHLSTALRMAEVEQGAIQFATLDRRLAMAARAHGLRVVGA